MSHALKGGAPRMMGDHSGAAGRQYGSHYKALLARFGPFDAITREHAGATSALWVQFREATAAVKAAQEARAKGKGRRPNAAALERLRRRQGLAWGSYEQAVRRLEELAADARRKPSGLEAVAALAARQAPDPPIAPPAASGETEPAS